VRLRNAWINVDPRGWKTRDDMTINVGLGSGGKAQQFAQTMAIANVQKQMVAAGKVNLVGDRELYNTAAELTRIMGHKNPDQFFKDPTAINPQTGQLLHPPPAPPSPPPDPKLVAAQTRAQLDQASAAHKAQLDQQQAQNDRIHQQVKIQAEIELARIKAGLDAKIALLDAHLKTLSDVNRIVQAFAATTSPDYLTKVMEGRKCLSVFYVGSEGNNHSRNGFAPAKFLTLGGNPVTQTLHQEGPRCSQERTRFTGWAFHVAVADAETVAGVVGENIHHETRLHTDERKLYTRVGAGFADHETIKLSQISAKSPGAFSAGGQSSQSVRFVKYWRKR
jgi:hypothetical protein